MADLLKPLGLALAIALAAPALAQDAQAPADGTATDAPATEAAPAATPELDMGTQATPAQPQTYIAETFDDWHQECMRAADGTESCYIAQYLRETPDATPIGKISMRRLPNGQQAEAFGEIVMPLGVVLPEHMSIQVDTSTPKVYDFRFCLQLGCVARVGFTAADVQGFKAGKGATVTVAAEGQPGQPPQPVTIPMGLKGFTKAYESLQVPTPQAAQ